MLAKYKILRAAEKAVIHRKFTHAIKEYEKYLQFEAEDPTVLNTIGDLLLREGRFQEALNYFHQVADIYSRNGFVVKAIAMYKKIHHLNPSDLKINETLAELYQKQGLTFEAARHLHILVERHQRLDQIGDALVYLKKLVALDSAAVEMQALLAQLLEQRGERAKAFDHYLEAHRLFLSRNLDDKAFEMAGKALQIDDTHKDALRSYVESGQKCGKVGDVERFLKERMELARQKYPFQMFQAWIHEQRGETEVAHSLYRELEDLGNYDPYIEDGLRRTAVLTDTVALPVSVESPGSDLLEWQSKLEQSGSTFPTEEPVEPVFQVAPENGGLRFELEPPLRPFDVEAGAEEELVEEPAPIHAAVAPVEEPAVESLEDALQETDFYLKLGFRDEAKKLLEVLLRTYPGDERVIRRAEKVMALPPTISAEPATASSGNGATDTSADFDLEIDSALEALFTGGSDTDAAPEILRYDIASSGQEEKNSPKIHYDLGLAYKEMGLIRDAIQEFLNAFQMLDTTGTNPQRILCCSMLANSFLQLSEFHEAINWAQEGLQIPEKKDFEWKALQHDLCTALEKSGEPDRALEGYKEILKCDPEYRDVQRRVEQLSLAHGQ